MADADADALRACLDDGVARLEPLTEGHREALRAACAIDRATWDNYRWSFLDPHFDTSFEAARDGAGRTVFAAFEAGHLVGMTGFINIMAMNRALEIGLTYLVPAARGTGVNRRFKDLLLDHAFASGFSRVEFRVDGRNARSQAAMSKLGAVREGTLRKDVPIWNGYVRDTVVYSILRDEWRKDR